MKGVSKINELLDEYMNSLRNNDTLRMISAWPGIAGSQLYGVTEFWKVEGEVLYVRVRSSAARNLVMLNSRRVIHDFNEAFPEHKIKMIRTARMS